MSEMETTVLDELLVTTRDGDWGRESPADGHVPYHVIRGADFEAARVRDVRSVPVRYLAKKTVARRTLQTNDVLIETAGGTRDRPTGRTLLVTRQLLDEFNHPVTCASFARFLRADETLVDRRYLFWFLQSIYSAGEMFQHQVQHTGVARFQFRRFSSTRHIPLPPIGSQRAIAEVLGALDDKIAANTKVAQTVDDFLGVFLASFLASASAEATLKEIADVNAESLKPMLDGSLRYIDIASIGVGSFDLPEVVDWAGAPSRARRRVRKGDTLWSTIRPNRRSHALNLSDDPLLVGSTGLAVLSPRETGFAYLYEVTKLTGFTTYLESAAEGSAYPAVRADRFGEAPVPLLPMSARETFESVAAPMREYAFSLSEQNRTLASTRDALLPQLMSGKIRVKDAEKTVEEVL